MGSSKQNSEGGSIMFTVYKVGLTGLSNKEHLNSNELDAWMDSVYGKFATVQVVNDATGQAITYTDNGTAYQQSK